jgi:hypothetical protein
MKNIFGAVAWQKMSEINCPKDFTFDKFTIYEP